MSILSRMRAASAREDRGVALLAVLMIMFVGAIAAVLIAGTVIFTIQTNAANKANTQAFIAAESGRDAVLANVLVSTCTLSASNPLGGASGPFYTAHADHCPSGTGADTFTITSKGFDVNGASSKIVSKYSRLVTYENQPGGSLAYFDGTFTLTQSQYKGDMVIRNGNFDCGTSNGKVDGDLWVLNGSVNLSTSCEITGNVYARYNVTSPNGSKATFDGSITAGGNVSILTNSSTVAKDILAGGTVDLTGKNTQSPYFKALQDVHAGGTITDPDGMVKGTKYPGVNPLPTDFYDNLDHVYAITTWVDINATRSLWGDDVQWVTPASCSADVTTVVTTAVTGGKTRLGIDYTGCTTAVTIKLSPGTIRQDTVFLVPGGVTMSVQLGGTPTAAAGTAQLFFIHGDAVADSTPTCVKGNASDSIQMPSSMTNVNVMFYTPCGVGDVHGNFNPFTGQFYAGNSGTTDWVQPTFTCASMSWTPLIDLGCHLSESDGEDGGGTLVPHAQPPVLVSQTEE